MGREPTSVGAALGSGLSSSVFRSVNGAHAFGTCAGAVALTAVGRLHAENPPWSRDGAQFLHQRVAQCRRARRSRRGVVVVLGLEDQAGQGFGGRNQRIFLDFLRRKKRKI